MKLTTILFDLDGTLLPMDNDEFTRGYFKLLAAKMAPARLRAETACGRRLDGDGRDGEK